MDAAQLQAQAVEFASVAARVMRQVYWLLDHWDSPPRELQQLQDNIDPFRGLIESAQRDGAVDITGSQNEALSSTVVNNVLAASNVLKHLEKILDNLAAETMAVDLRAKWSRQRNKFNNLLIELHGKYLKVFNALLSLNVMVSQGSTQNQAILSMAKEESAQELPTGLAQADSTDKITDFAEKKEPPDGLSSEKFIHWRTTEKVLVDRTSEKTLGSISPSWVQASRNGSAPSTPASSSSLLSTAQPSALRRAHNGSPLHDVELADLVRTLDHPLDSHRRRTIGNDLEFRRLEAIFSVVATSFSLPSSEDDHTGTRQRTAYSGQHHALPLQRRCEETGCSCLHSGGHGRISLHAFRYALGAVTFVFTAGGGQRSGCDHPSCIHRTSPSWRLVYSFPSWLFHAAVSATFSSTNGGPELVLRVLRRVSTDLQISNPTIFNYITRDDPEALKHALKRKEVSVFDIRADRGRGVLAVTIMFNKCHLLELLLSEGADLFQPDDAGFEASYAALSAIWVDDRVAPEISKRLKAILPLDRMLESAGLSMLHKAAMGLLHVPMRDYARQPARRAELNAFDIAKNTPLVYAVARGDLAAVEGLLAAGAQPDPEVGRGALNWTALQKACAKGYVDIVRRLVEAGADVHVNTSVNGTALHTICTFAPPLPKRPYGPGDGVPDEVQIGQYLLRHGAEVNCETGEAKSTPLDSAVYKNRWYLVELLLDAGADTSHGDWEGTNAIGNALLANSVETIAVLLRRKADVKTIDNQGYTTLHYVAGYASVQIMKLFTQASQAGGITELIHWIDRPDREGRTPMQLCLSRPDANENLEAAFTCLLDSLARRLMEAQCLEISDTESVDFFDAQEELWKYGSTEPPEFSTPPQTTCI